jgi:hypothetical protein
MNKKKDTAITVAIITGVFGIIGILIIVFGKDVKNKVAGRLKVTAVNVIKCKKKQGVEMTFKNLSDNLETLNSVKILFFPSTEKGLGLDAVITTTSYTIDDKLNFSADSNSRISYKVTGRLYHSTDDQWSMIFELPVQQELASQRSCNVDVFLPKMMAVTRIFTSIQRPGTGRPPEIDSTSVKDSVNLPKLLTEAVSTAGVIVSINGAGSVNVDGLEDQIKFNP